MGCKRMGEGLYRYVLDIDVCISLQCTLDIFQGRNSLHCASRYLASSDSAFLQTVVDSSEESPKIKGLRSTKASVPRGSAHRQAQSWSIPGVTSRSFLVQRMLRQGAKCLFIFAITSK